MVVYNKTVKKASNRTEIGSVGLHSKKIGFLRNPQKRFRRLENVSKCVKMLKKRIFNSTEPLKVLPADTRGKNL